MEERTAESRGDDSGTDFIRSLTRLHAAETSSIRGGNAAVALQSQGWQQNQGQRSWWFYLKQFLLIMNTRRFQHKQQNLRWLLLSDWLNHREAGPIRLTAADEDDEEDDEELGGLHDSLLQ